MKQLTSEFPRILTRSLSILVMSGLLFYNQMPSSAENSIGDPALERLWNQSLDDPSPQIRSTPPSVQNLVAPKVDSKPILPEQQALKPQPQVLTAEQPMPPAPQAKTLKNKKVSKELLPALLVLPQDQTSAEGTEIKPTLSELLTQSGFEPKQPAKAPLYPERVKTQGDVSKLAEAQQLTNAYVALLTQWQQAKGKESLEPILNKGQEAAVAILKVADALSEEEFKALGKKIPGYLMIHSDILVVGPDPNFFVTLATQKGKPVDVAFFKLVSETLNGYWPSTMEQLDNLSGCTRFGTGQLTDLYGGWTKFKQQYPKAYQKALQDPNLLLIHDIEDQLLNSASACEGPESVVQELEKFVLAYPRSPLTPSLQKRLEALRQNKTDMVFNQGVRHLAK